MKFNNRNLYISDKAVIGKNVRIGDNSVIYDNVHIGDDTIIANDCVIGEPAQDYYYNPAYQNSETFIGNNCLIRSHAIIYCGNKIGMNVKTGHNIMLRENNVIGDHCRIGNYTELHGNIEVGIYSSFHSAVRIAENSIIGDFVWIAPNTSLTNDLTPPSLNWKSPRIGNFSFIAVNCVILPGIQIGIHCLIGASSLVSKNVEDYKVCVGSPCRIVSDVRDFSIDGIKYYPWPYNFKRGMPWEDIGYEEWEKKNRG
jgi:acetyltransferase-like isoleucine patch superfamily enzyme